MTKQKVEIQHQNGEVLHPLTHEDCVMFDDGSTLHDKISDLRTDMYTPTVECSSNMFKIGQGDSVDYSGNVIDGAYNSCILKGKTMVNCIQEPSSQDVVLPYEFEDGQYVTINDTKESGALGVELKGQTLVNSVLFIDKTLPYTWVSNNISSRTCSLRGNFKTGTYVLIVDFGEVLLGGVQSSQGVSCSIQVNYTNGTLDAYVRNGLENYSNKRLFTPFNINNEVSTIEFKGISEQYENATTEGYIPPTVTVNKIMIIEYQEGMENWDIPYFTGMTSCKMPILHTVGKNLFEGEFVLGEWNGIRIIESLNRLASSKLIEVRGGSTLTLSSQVYQIRMLTFLDENKKWIGHSVLNDSNTLTVKTPNNCKYIGFNLRKSDNTNFTEDEIKINSNVMVEYETQATPFEPYKTSILSLPEEVVLRSLPNGVCDTFNIQTGVYIRRIKEIVLNGTEGWYLQQDYGNGAYRYKLTLKDHRHQSINIPVICDKIPVYTSSQLNDTIFGLSSQAESDLQITIPSSFAQQNGIDGTPSSLKTWLSTLAPIAVQYELIEPIVTKINLPSTLKSWNTTTHIYSEIPENTLYPILSHSNPSYPVILKPSTKYSIVTNSYSNNHTNSAINFNLGGATTSTTVGNRVTTITTPSTLTSEELVMSGRGNKLNNVMVIEGDVMGDEPYFEGICDVKSPILSNCGKNLAKLTRSYTSFGLTFKVIDDTLYVDGTAERILDYYLTINNCENSKMLNSLEVGTMVTLSNSLGLRNYFGVWRNGTTDDSWFANTITIQNGDNNIRCFIRFDQGSTYNNQAIKIQLEATQNPTTYEPYKSNTTTFEQKDDKTIVLRSLPNGVCDTLNVETGEYVQRIGEYRVTGGEEETYYTDGQAQYIYISNTSELMGMKSTSVLVCDKFPYHENYAVYDYPKVSSTGVLIFVLPTSATGLSTKEEREAYIKNLAKTEGITIQYELATPIVSTVDVQGFPYAYTNGHVQLSSGHNGQSLTPKVEYSVTTNRTGQLETTTKRVIEHEKQINDLEALVLSNIIDSDYQSTLLSFEMELL